MYPFIETNYNGLLKALREKKAFDDTIKAEAKKALDAFKEAFKASLPEKSKQDDNAKKEEDKAQQKISPKQERAAGSHEAAPAPAAH
jgi:hypothetical protein